MQLGLPVEHIHDPNYYLGQARVEFKNILLSGIPVSDFHADAQMQNGEVVLSELVAKLGAKGDSAKGKIAPGEIIAAGRIDIREKGAVHLRSQASSVPMELFRSGCLSFPNKIPAPSRLAWMRKPQFPKRWI